MSDDVRVLYIAGWGRSGSTLLNRLLGEVDGFFAAGELRFLWQRNLEEHHACGCGEPFRDCPVWRGVLERSGVERADVDVRGLLDRAVDDRRIPALLAPGGPRRVVEALGPAREWLVRLYRGIRDETGCRVVVDASKVPTYGRLLAATPGLDVRVVHLVRDSRAVAWSWLRRKMQRDVGRPMLQRSAFESAWRWVVRNAEVELLSRGVLRLRYETLIDRPEATLARIAAFAGEAGATLPFARPGVARLGTSHTSSGNPDRFAVGETPLLRDEEWRRSMRRRDRLVVTGITWPAMLAYGYWRGAR